MEIIDGVNIPDELMEAHNRGELVFFVGAGASMAPPTNFPSYRQLADSLMGLLPRMSIQILLQCWATPSTRYLTLANQKINGWSLSKLLAE